MDKDLVIEEPRFEEDKVRTERDFDEMGWLDATFHGIAFFPEKYEIALDIDYIFEWLNSEERKGYYDFRVAPATLVFENIHNFVFDMGEAYRTLQIKYIERTDPRKPPNAEYIEKETEWKWTIEFEFGHISFYSVGFKQFIRKEPLLIRSQTLSLEDRGGINFERIGFSG